MTEIFFADFRRFFAALLGGTQEKATTKLRKIACQRFMFSYEDGAKDRFFTFVIANTMQALRVSLRSTHIPLLSFLPSCA